MKKATQIRRAAIFPRSCLRSLMSMFFRSFPQAGQKLCCSFGFCLHFGQGGVLVFCVNSWILRIFSDMVRSRRVPRKMRVQPPRRWKACMAVCIPYWLPMRTMVVILRMLSV